MTIQSETHEITFPTGEGPWTWDQAEALIGLVEDMFHRVDVNALVNGFTEDCVFHFADQPEQQGREALRKLFSARLARQQNYRLKKTVLAIDGNRLANKWEGTWTDRNSGKDMAGFGVEVWVMRNGKIADWQAAFNVWEVGGERGSSVM